MKYWSWVIISLEILIISILAVVLVEPSGVLGGFLILLSFIQMLIGVKFKETKPWILDVLIVQFMVILTLTLAILLPVEVIGCGK